MPRHSSAGEEVVELIKKEKRGSHGHDNSVVTVWGEGVYGGRRGHKGDK